MKAWIQRVAEASVTIDGERVAEIGRGYLVLLGVTHTDTEAVADRLADRIPVLRLFTDDRDLMNLSLEDVSGSVIVVSQFTLYADNTTVYTAQFLDTNWDCGLDERELTLRFHVGNGPWTDDAQG